ncbi:hypothetical protein RF11_04803 [Thelohanellus kitauei]|uniref:Uncharacterized protein n=1 Tax=Thelohanellus kitauei TaxID=669202 RepID=A0A0C2N922_THEKT|nr:hypothetical protein RF11_04803 [Thelohanellus kitauei]
MGKRINIGEAKLKNRSNISRENWNPPNSQRRYEPPRNMYNREKFHEMSREIKIIDIPVDSSQNPRQKDPNFENIRDQNGITDVLQIQEGEMIPVENGPEPIESPPEFYQATGYEMHGSQIFTGQGAYDYFPSQMPYQPYIPVVYYPYPNLSYYYDTQPLYYYY